jgi:hypothetical protein
MLTQEDIEKLRFAMRQELFLAWQDRCRSLQEALLRVRDRCRICTEAEWTAARSDIARQVQAAVSGEWTDPAQEEVLRLRKLVQGLADRVAAQSELLSKKAERSSDV